MPGALAASAFISALLLASTVPHHWRIRSFATLSIIAWLLTHETIKGINAAIWADNVGFHGDYGHVWCDISTKLELGSAVGLPGSCLALSIRLFRIVRGYDSDTNMRGNRILDLVLCYGTPILVMSLHIIVQGHRYNIIEAIGCIPTIYYSWPAIVIIELPIIVLSSLCPIYSLLTIWSFYRRYRTSHSRIHYHSSSSTGPKCVTSIGCFVRLLLATTVISIVTLAMTILQVFTVYGVLRDGLPPWVSWAFVHAEFEVIERVAFSEMASADKVQLLIYWWPWPIAAVALFLFFSVGREARQEWRSRWEMMAAVLRLPRRPAALSRKGSGRSAGADSLFRRRMLVLCSPDPERWSILSGDAENWKSPLLLESPPAALLRDAEEGLETEPRVYIRPLPAIPGVPPVIVL
ncbi:Fungal pheromone STE3G-protein-coupled receptor [Mycena kentingensis (nom. inval.)]|nr:Fungal pheromone STE3G-protein-coupled receptor [Mycena kentingensis (nom. inval.)]